MLKFLKKLENFLIRNFLEKNHPLRLEQEHTKTSFSQEAEDLLLERIFGLRANGFFVDVGAHHPLRFSNTYLFYRRGWRGINIDASPGSMSIFKKIRPLDVNLEMGVGPTESELTFFCFNEPALNTFSPELAKERAKIPEYKVIAEKKVHVKPLATILDQHVPPQTSIDFLSIDVEGLDLEVLESNDWSKYRPKIILAESLNFSLNNISSNATVGYLQKQGYLLFSKSVNTLLFRHKDFVI